MKSGCWWVRNEACKRKFICDQKPIIVKEKFWSKLILKGGGQVHYWKNGVMKTKQILYKRKLYELGE
ncbi:MAG: hypothetical protein KAS32_12970 [Candidatus Peribacteraceae bacterium]|nr:hypothetical protein [Candidatus Peribacteraceae bacterium]